jgi:hypothetical protein
VRVRDRFFRHAPHRGIVGGHARCRSVGEHELARKSDHPSTGRGGVPGRSSGATPRCGRGLNLTGDVVPQGTRRPPWSGLGLASDGAPGVDGSGGLRYAARTAMRRGPGLILRAPVTTSSSMGRRDSRLRLCHESAPASSGRGNRRRRLHGRSAPSEDLPHLSPVVCDLCTCSGRR